MSSTEKYSAALLDKDAYWSYDRIVQLEKLNYSNAEAAFLLGLSIHTITRDVRKGVIRARRYGRRILIPREEVLRIAAEGMQPAAEAR